MKIQERPEYRSKPKPLTFTADTPVKAAVAAMSENNFGSVVIVDADSRVSGLVTERDIMKRLVNEGRDAGKTNLADIMTSDVRVAHPGDEVVDWLRIMSNERFRRLPVVDEAGKCVAIMTQGDLVSYTWPDLIEHGKQLVKSTASVNSQTLLIAGGAMIYTIVLLAMMKLI